ncbi:hypothetical protein KAR91_83805 [Candidatus Pacearchaeota archaeon]|nr:hypothetical protein [Candidatus Pacearchaeota archaeon]
MPLIEGGTVVKIGLWKLSEAQVNFRASNGEQYNLDKTHRIAIQIAGLWENGEEATGKLQWVGIGNYNCEDKRDPEKYTWRRPIGDGWEDLLEGAKVTFMYKHNGQYVNATMKTFEVEAQGDRWPSSYSQQKGGSSGGGGQRNGPAPLGIKYGACVDMASRMIGKNPPRMKELNSIAMLFHTLNEAMCKEFKEVAAFSGLGDFDLRVAVGRALVSSCDICSEMVDVEKAARYVMNSTYPTVTKFIVDGKAPAAQQQERQEPAKEEPKPEPEPTPEPELQSSGESSGGSNHYPDYDDDDIPF